MKPLLGFVLALTFTLCSAKPLKISSPTEQQALVYVAYREASGESVETIRAVLDVVYNRHLHYEETMLETILRKGSFPYITKSGIRVVNDKKFLLKYKKAVRMKPLLGKHYIYFNHKPFKKWGRNTRKIGKMYFQTS